VPFPALLEVLESANQPFMLMVELNPAEQRTSAPDQRSPLQLAQLSRSRLHE
jgi:hypothetical protein